MNGSREVREAGPTRAARRVLLIPGGMRTTDFHGDVPAEPALSAAGPGLERVAAVG